MEFEEALYYLGVEKARNRQQSVFAKAQNDHVASGYCESVANAIEAVLQIVEPFLMRNGCFCKDCKMFKPHPTAPDCYICDPCPLNNEYSPFVKPDGFCSFGIIKD